MKHFAKRVSALAVALAVTPGLAAFAAPAQEGIAVQLDGKDLTFTDAAPVARDNRTFLPFRAVFEAMGATVDSKDDAITAVKDGVTVTMTIGSTQATVTDKAGTTTTVTMDVAPYVDNATWRTYVPVRFAAQTMGCTVGWDGDAQTVILMDTAALAAAAVEGKQYTILAKYADYAKQFNAGKWAVNGDLKGTVIMDLSALTQDDAQKGAASAPMTFSAVYDGLTADASKVQMDMTMKLDMEQFLAAISAAAGQTNDLSADEAAMLKSLKDAGITMGVRGDLTTGKLYLNMTGDALKSTDGTAAVDPNTWYTMDLNAMMEQSGLDLSTLMAAAKAFDVETVMSQYLTLLAPDDVSDYASVQTTLNQIAAAVADDGFTKTGGDYTTSITMGDGSAKSIVDFTLNTSNDKVVGYSMSTKMTMNAGDDMVMTMTAAMDKSNKMTAKMTMAGDGMDMTVDMTGAYKTTDKTPAVEPPEGATIGAAWAGAASAGQSATPAPEEASPEA